MPVTRHARPARQAGAVAVSLVAAVMTACTGASDRPPPNAASAGPTGDSTVLGTAESISDVSGHDPAPMDDRTLLVLPRPETTRLWDVVEHMPSDDELPYVGGLLEPAEVEQWQLVEIADGRFGLNAADGDYLVCLLSGEFVLNGCAEATITGPTTWSATHGEGGFEVRG